ncbi:MAG: hypothetical protein KGY66_01695 [Candidatus Thermoplasmatota archaeon]|nr:hypothetical protein [Candidatus Thermoplasmatota archaeon]MBS3789610.1 hypothetical protein [Candidatus Thermoplasmatota archaeon]
MLVLTFSILIAGTTDLIGSSAYKDKGELENPLNTQHEFSSITPFDSFSMRDSSTQHWRSKGSILSTNERLPLIPHSDSDSVGEDNTFYTFNFSAREGDKIHMMVYVTKEASVQIVLMPREELSGYLRDPNFGEVEKKIPTASEEQTRYLETHLTIPEDDEYSLVIRFPFSDTGTGQYLGYRSTEFEIIIGRGLFSSIVVRAGGYIELFFISSFLVIVSGTVFYLYKKRKKKSPPNWETEDPSEEDIRIAERKEGFSSKDPPVEEEPEKSPTNDNEYLQYGD